MEFHHINQIVVGRKQFHSAPMTQECSGVTPTKTLVFSGSSQEFTKVMRAIPTWSYGKKFKIASGPQSIFSMSHVEQLSV